MNRLAVFRSLKRGSVRLCGNTGAAPGAIETSNTRVRARHMAIPPDVAVFEYELVHRLAIARTEPISPIVTHTRELRLPKLGLDQSFVGLMRKFAKAVS